jgi:ATP-dependent DNA helicase DinG
MMKNLTSPENSPFDIGEVFAADGPLARAIAGFLPRKAQTEMAQAVYDALAHKATAVLEAGTGVGKTFAYLAPIVGGEVSALISTGTRALQDQLFQSDLPRVARALGKNANAALLKGRGNYLCRQRLEDANKRGGFFGKGDLAKINRFASATISGDIADASGIAAASPLWEAVTSTRENCLGQKCPHYNDCHFYRARAQAREARIVVVNHHLFLADLRLRDAGVAEILPARDAVVFDEAHLLPDTAAQFFGEQAATAALVRFARDGEAAAIADAPNDPGLAAAARALAAAASAAGSALGYPPGQTATAADSKIAREAALTSPGVKEKLQMLANALAAWEARLKDAAADSERLAANWLRAQRERDFVDRWRSDDEGGDNGGDEDDEKNENKKNSVRWLERRAGAAIMHTSPLEAGEMFRERVFAEDDKRAVIFTSATLAVGGGFGDFQSALGIRESQARAWESPFDFAHRALLYLPPRMPDPNDAAHPPAVVDALAPLIRANGGRAFVLFAGKSAMRAGAAALKESLGGEFDILTQGDAPSEELLARFRAAADGKRGAVLAATRSFWFGVDVKGGALSIVAIDKIPFAPPDDPVTAARAKMWEKRGESAFLRGQLPQAALLMRQAAGRLIRGVADYGALALCDPRLTARNYGAKILNALPPMPRTRSCEQAAAFLRRQAAAAQEGRKD